MRLALEQAKIAADDGEVPVGAVLTEGERLLAAAGNSPIGLNDPTAHAEILVLREAAAQHGNYRLPGTTLYVTLEPCIMCMGAIIQARVEPTGLRGHRSQDRRRALPSTPSAATDCSTTVSRSPPASWPENAPCCSRIFSAPEGKPINRVKPLRAWVFYRQRYFLIAKSSHDSIHSSPHLHRAIR